MWIVLGELMEMDKTMIRTIYFYNDLLYCSWQIAESGFRNWLNIKKAIKLEDGL